MARQSPAERIAARVAKVAYKQVFPATSPIGKVVRKISSTLQWGGYSAVGGGSPLQTGAEALGKGGKNPLNPASRVARKVIDAKYIGKASTLWDAKLSPASLPPELVDIGADIIRKAEKRGFRRPRGASGSF